VPGCSRCDFRPTDDPDVGHREQLAFHAAESDHPLCIACSRSLQKFEGGFTCDGCLNDARVLLAGIVTMWTELPQHLGHLRSPSYDSDPPGASDGRQLPGGDILALLGPGSPGWAEDGHSTKDGDPLSVSFELGWWAMKWQEMRGESRSLRTVEQIAGYLEVAARWAATSHPGFDTYLRDLRKVHGMLERATARHNPLERANAACFGCGQDALVRKLTDAGYADEWTCRRCHKVYDWPRYLLAIRGRLQETDDPVWGVPEHVAHTLGVRPQTVRNWADRGHIASACHVDDRRLRVNWADAHDHAQRTSHINVA